MNPSFTPFSFENPGVVYDGSGDDFPTRLHVISGADYFRVPEGSTCFLIAYQGKAHVDGLYLVQAGMYAAASKGFFQTHECFRGIVIERIGYRGMFVLGGPLEDEGRLKYIDGCTDSLLIPPVKFGDACLNHLHFPPGIDQTMHTHPSIRVGIVTNGEGECVTPWGNVPLFPGQIFIIHPENGEWATAPDGKDYLVGSHCFRTFDGVMDVVAYHPDSDFGPRDEEHPMINRTIVNGVSAKNIDEIRTK